MQEPQRHRGRFKGSGLVRQQLMIPISDAISTHADTNNLPQRRPTPDGEKPAAGHHRHAPRQPAIPHREEGSGLAIQHLQIRCGWKAGASTNHDSAAAVSHRRHSSGTSRQSPNKLDAKRFQQLIATDERQTFERRLRRQHAVERIADALISACALVMGRVCAARPETAPA